MQQIELIAAVDQNITINFNSSDFATRLLNPENGTTRIKLRKKAASEMLSTDTPCVLIRTGEPARHLTIDNIKDNNEWLTLYCRRR